MRSSILFSPLYWQSIIILTQNALARQHRNTFLGNMWNLIQPFTHIVIISYFFGFLLRQSSESLAGNLVASLPLWNFLSSGIITSANSLISREGIIKKVVISRSIFPLVDTLVSAYILIYTFIAMYGAYILFFPGKFTWLVIFVPFLIIPLIITVLSLSITVAFLTPYIRDIPQVLSLLLSVIYWTIPIIYPYSMIPESKKIFFELNPVYCLLRPVMMVITDHTFPSPIIIFKAIIVGILAVIISFYIHKRFSKNVIFYL